MEPCPQKAEGSCGRGLTANSTNYSQNYLSVASATEFLLKIVNGEGLPCIAVHCSKPPTPSAAWRSSSGLLCHWTASMRSRSRIRSSVTSSRSTFSFVHSIFPATDVDRLFKTLQTSLRTSRRQRKGSKHRKLRSPPIKPSHWSTVGIERPQGP